MSSSFDQLKILFIPVSCDTGSGEYVRSSILADGFKEEWVNTDIRFVLSRQAPYLSACKYKTYLTDKSPTFHTNEVNKIITEFKPDFVLFDAAGRVSQIRHAKKSGAKVIYIAYYDKKIKRALQLRCLPFIDQIWVSQPKFALSELSFWSKWKLKFFKKPDLIYLGSVYRNPTAQKESDVLGRFGLTRNNYFLVSAGGGGHFVNKEKMAPELFYDAAKNTGGEDCLVQVWGANYNARPIPSSSESELHIKSLENEDFVVLMKNAKYLLISAGDTLLQAISLAKPVLAVSVAKDQDARITRILERKPAILTSKTDVTPMSAELKKLRDSKIREQLEKNALSLSVGNGNQIATSSIHKLM